MGRDRVVLERESLRQLRLHALDTLSERPAQQGLPPLALEHHHAFRRLLRAELGVEPSVRFARMLPQSQL